MHGEGRGPLDALNEIEVQRRFAERHQEQPQTDTFQRERFSLRALSLSVLDLLFYAVFIGVKMVLCVMAYAFVTYAERIGITGLAAAIVAFLVSLASFVTLLRSAKLDPERRVGHRGLVMLVLLGHEFALVAMWLVILGLAL